jgi:GxxExxY protein
LNHEAHEGHEENSKEFEPLSKSVIGLALKVHKALGPGLLESAYEACLEYELRKAEMEVERQKALPLQYDGMIVETAFRIDLIVNKSIIIEVKAVDAINSIHEAQLMTYLKLSNVRTGLIINFNSKLLKSGIRRFVL